MKGLPFEKTEDDIVTPEEDILKLLRKKKGPVSKEEFLGELAETTGWNISAGTLDRYIEFLANLGYDIKSIANEIVLVRFSVDSQDAYYRILGKIETPFIITADHHIGCRTFSQAAFDQMIRDVEEYSVKDVIIPGDIMQGRGVHRMELQDVKLLKITDQITEAARLYNNFPDGTVLHTVMGTHEEKIKGSIHVGLDVLNALTPELKGGLVHRYYGHVGKLSVNENHTLLMLHGGGGMSYALTYMVQKIDRNLVERPSILLTGHLHQLYMIPVAGHRWWAMAGTTQKENSYLITKGITSQVGYAIVNRMDNSGMDLIYRTPETW